MGSGGQRAAASRGTRKPPAARHHVTHRAYHCGVHAEIAGEATRPETARVWGGRALHLVDVDNLIGDPRRAAPTLIRATLGLYRDVSGYRAGDLVVLATNHGLALEVGLAWPCVRLLARSGPDGADLALLDEVDFAMGGRFDRVIIGGGDHIYEGAVRRLHAAGVHAAVVSRPEALARLLRLAAREVILLAA